MDKFNFVMDSFNRDGTMNGTMYCCNNDTVTIDTDFGENTTRIKGLKFCPSDDIGVNVKDRLEDYVRKDEFEDLINKISNNYAVSHDDMADSFRFLYERLIKGNKKKNENSFLNYEKEIVGYELLYDAK